MGGSDAHLLENVCSCCTRLKIRWLLFYINLSKPNFLII
ncbi:MAG: hypothetical protein EF806_04890 [Candidatus Methanoliparum thermophilum]|uniref:Uncharacterized protein n=1 Tax=Methanoliparum thermophilum TaxID=2491083 RepID=A0A520KRJ8_METT2|nr:MAG: hypothetical protein EF806_04890 [Candidatus Methanoliparum thermophilum]